MAGVKFSGSYDADRYYYPIKKTGRVKYNANYNSGSGLYSLPKAPELILACENAASGVFYDSGNDYEPIEFDSSLLNTNYGDQIFFDADNNKNLVILAEALAGDCLVKMNKFINNSSSNWLLSGGVWADSGTWDDSAVWID